MRFIKDRRNLPMKAPIPGKAVDAVLQIVTMVGERIPRHDRLVGGDAQTTKGREQVAPRIA